jgi:aminopeptidase N
LAVSRSPILRALLGAAALSVGALHTARAQRSRPYRPAFDVSDYAITIDLPDTGSTIHGQALITVARVARADTLKLDLLDLDVNSVSVDGRAAKFARTTDGIDIVLPSRKSTTATFEVKVEYGGAVKDGLIVRQDSAGRWTYFGDNWPNRARHWIPSIDHPSDKATVTWRVRAPATRSVIANGRLMSRKPIRDTSGGDRVETVWRESKPIAPYLMVIAAAPLSEYDVGDTACGLAELQRCVPQFVYVAPEQRSFLPGPFARVGEIVQLFSTLVGPFPYEKLAHLQSSTRFGGMENASAIFYADGGFRRGTMRDGVVAHETAHQWFGDAVTERDWPHLWLSEGFATYFAALWTRAARGDSAFRGDMATIRRTVLADTEFVARRPVIDTVETNLMELLNANSYQKGGFVLHMLRDQVGEGAFFSALKEYYRKNRHSTAVTDDLQAEMEGASKQQLGWFFDEWLRKPGYPTVQASWRYDADHHETVIDLAQAGPFGAYEFPITVAAVDSAGALHRANGRMKPNGGAIQLRIPTATPPASIMLDPDVELLAVFHITP